jgi:hypothetical protein
VLPRPTNTERQSDQACTDEGGESGFRHGGNLDPPRLLCSFFPDAIGLSTVSPNEYNSPNVHNLA